MFQRDAAGVCSVVDDPGKADAISARFWLALQGRSGSTVSSQVADDELHGSSIFTRQFVSESQL